MRSERWFMFVTLLGLIALLLAACSSAPTPAPTAASIPPKPANTSSSASQTTGNKNDTQASESAFETESDSGGSVTVDVKPTSLAVGQPVAFDIAMNTHSVDLGDDLTKTALLRDDAGKEYKPIGWEGPAGGGHHRSGTLTFPALTAKPKYVELVIKGLAQVPERVFKWDLP